MRLYSGTMPHVSVDVPLGRCHFARHTLPAGERPRHNWYLYRLQAQRPHPLIRVDLTGIILEVWDLTPHAFYNTNQEKLTFPASASLSGGDDDLVSLIGRWAGA